MSDYQKNAAGRQLVPYSIDAERGVVGSMLIGGPEVVCEMEAILSPDMFFVPANARLFWTLQMMNKSGIPVDLITVTQTLMDEGSLEECGGAASITELLGNTPTAANANHYAKIVREKALLRQIISTCTDAIRRAHDEQDVSVEMQLDDLQGAILQIGELTKTEAQARHIREGVSNALDAIDQTYHSRGKCIGLSTGFVDLDRMTGGLKGGQMFIIAARPAMGKTAIALNIAANVAKEKKAVAFFSVEMSFDELCARALCSEAELNLARVRDGFMSHSKFDDLARASTRMADMPIYIDDTAAISIQEFRRRARKMKKQLGIQAIIIDYVGLMKSNTKRAQENRQLEIGEISAGIKQTAKELNIPIILLAQLNRNAEQRTEMRPQLSDLRESGNLEQDADIVAMPFRPEYYVKNPEKRVVAAEKMDLAVEEWERHAELIVAKQRNGPVGTIKLWFDAPFARFSNRTEKLYSNADDDRQQ